MNGLPFAGEGACPVVIRLSFRCRAGQYRALCRGWATAFQDHREVLLQMGPREWRCAEQQCGCHGIAWAYACGLCILGLAGGAYLPVGDIWQPNRPPLPACHLRLLFRPSRALVACVPLCRPGQTTLMAILYRDIQNRFAVVPSPGDASALLQYSRPPLSTPHSPPSPSPRGWAGDRHFVNHQRMAHCNL